MALHMIVNTRTVYSSEHTLAMDFDDEQYWYMLRDMYPDMDERKYEFAKYLYNEGVLNKEPWWDGQGATIIGDKRISQCDGKRLILI